MGFLSLILTLTLAACDESSFDASSGSKASTEGDNGGGNGGGTDTVAGNAEAGASEEAKTLLAECKGKVAEIKEMPFDLKYPAGANCAFGVDGNLPAQDAIHTAKLDSPLTINIPANIEICELEITSQSKSLRYDDFLIFSLDKYVLVGSNGTMMTQLPKEGAGLLVWDWQKVIGTAIDFDERLPSYCLGKGKCEIPGHDKEGPFNVRFPSESIYEVAAAQLAKNQLIFTLTTTGDNDMGDCEHTDFDLDLVVRYIEK
ncbi:MAG: hypothetical protein AB7T49_20895 [Oligoflexales bacterium]